MAKKALGRGLGAIFEDVEKAYNAEMKEHNSAVVRDIEISAIKPNPYQPRTKFDEKALKELSKSIKKHGLLQPIVVVEKDDYYMLIAGERRLRAAKLAGMNEITAILADFGSKNLRELALIENIQRENLNPIELANAYNELINEYKITQEELSGIIHKSRVQITNTMRLLALSKETQNLISDGKVSQGHAKVIVGLNPKDETAVVNTIIGRRLSVRETESLVKNLKENKTEKTNEKKSKNLNLDELIIIFKNFGIKSKIKSNGIFLSFDNEKQVQEFLKKINKI